MRTGTAIAEITREEQTKPGNVLARRFALFVAVNPLRVWRVQNNATIALVCSMLGTSVSSVQAWESGASIPTPESLAKIAGMIGNEQLHEEWDNWIANRPKSNPMDYDERYDG